MRSNSPRRRPADRKFPAAGEGRNLLGPAGEEAAARALRRRGYRIVERNYRCSWGEIDLVARDGEILVFVEVKCKRSGGFLAPTFSVTARKQRTLARAAWDYLLRRNLSAVPCRFDVVSVLWPRGGKPRCEIIPGAFEVDPSRS